MVVSENGKDGPELLAKLDSAGAWKTFDWDALNRLFKKEFIDDPVNRAKSVALTDKGLVGAERLFRVMFVNK